ncbi:MAG: hypothetical protein PWP31_139 [Clostridia bacterium]|nr:hypothetical protein [Clostridia bacterium]
MNIVGRKILTIIGLFIFIAASLLAYHGSKLMLYEEKTILRDLHLWPSKSYIENQLESLFGKDEALPVPAKKELKKEHNDKTINQDEVEKSKSQENTSKRHLAVKDGYIVIYEGPNGSQGKLLTVTDYKIDSLPVDWQNRIKNGQAEFNSENELLEALDSLDEYK